MIPAIYDTKEGIASFLTDLESINRLQTLRREAYSNRGERMGDWVVLGRWVLDTCGNFNPIVPGYSEEGKILAEMGTCPPVMTMDEAYLFSRGGSITHAHAWALPPHYATCKTCGEKWTLENCYDFHTSDSSDEGAVSLEDFVGQPLAEVKKIPALVGKVVHFVDNDAVYNDNLPDPPTDEKDYRRENTRLSRNKKKWHYVPQDYVIQAGDHAMTRYVLFEHRACQQQRVTQDEREDIVKAFANAGYPKVNLITKKNGYCGHANCKCPPWFLAQVGNEPPITIGWRKRVINVDWTDSGKKLPDLFASEEVTRDSTHIHAWSYEKLSEYLGKLMPALGVPLQVEPHIQASSRDA